MYVFFRDLVLVPISTRMGISEGSARIRAGTRGRLERLLGKSHSLASFPNSDHVGYTGLIYRIVLQMRIR